MCDNLLGPLTEWPDVFREHVLKNLNPTDLCLLSQTNKRVRAAVEESGKPVAGAQGAADKLQLVLFMGSDNMAMWARSNARCMSGPLVCSQFAEKGDFEGLQRAYHHGWPMNEWTCCESAHAGRIDMLRWARNKGCPWGESTMVFAARQGHLSVIKWAHANGAPFSPITCSVAAFSGHLHVMKWVHAKSLPWSILYLPCINNAVVKGRTETVEWMQGLNL